MVTRFHLTMTLRSWPCHYITKQLDYVRWKLKFPLLYMFLYNNLEMQRLRVWALVPEGAKELLCDI